MKIPVSRKTARAPRSLRPRPAVNHLVDRTAGPRVSGGDCPRVTHPWLPLTAALVQRHRDGAPQELRERDAPPPGLRLGFVVCVLVERNLGADHVITIVNYDNTCAVDAQTPPPSGWAAPGGILSVSVGAAVGQGTTLLRPALSLPRHPAGND